MLPRETTSTTSVSFPKGRTPAKTCPQGYKTFFMLNSVEHETLNAHKYKKIKKFSCFLGPDKPRMLFFLLINVKMPTIYLGPYLGLKNS